MLKTVRYGAWGLVALVLLLGGAVATGWYLSGSELRGNVLAPVSGTGTAEIGGPFSLTTHRGEAVTEEDFAGKPSVVFFGFTMCPDVCPTTLMDISSWLDELGPDAGRLNVLLISVDPERDTVDQLAAYMSAFDPRITALTGTPEQVKDAAAAYKAYYRKVPLEGGDYTMDHTATVYLMKADGSFMGTADRHGEKDVAVQKLRLLLDGTDSG